MIIEAHLKPGGTFETLSYHDPERGVFTVCYKYVDALTTEVYPNVDWDDILKYVAKISSVWHDKFYIEGTSSINVIIVALTREIDRNLSMFQQMMQ